MFLINETVAKNVEIYANRGCDGGPTSYFEFKSDKNTYREAYKSLIEKKRTGNLGTDDLYSFSKIFWGLKDIPNEPKVTADIAI